VGSIGLAPLRKADIPFAVSLTQSEGWGFSPEDFERFVVYEPDGCLLATIEEMPVGLITSVSYGTVGWIGNVIVAPEHRRHTVGRVLLEGALAHLEERGVPTIRLNSYETAIGFYRRFGFVEEHGVQRYVGELTRPAPEHGPTPSSATWQAILEFDRQCLGADRSRVLLRLAQDFPGLCIAHATPFEATGYVLGKTAPSGSEAGPLVAVGGEAQARELLTRLCARLPPGPAEVGLSEVNAWAAPLAASLGLRRSFRAVQMRRGPPVEGEQLSALIAVGGFEKG